MSFLISSKNAREIYRAEHNYIYYIPIVKVVLFMSLDESVSRETVRVVSVLLASARYNALFTAK